MNEEQRLVQKRMRVLEHAQKTGNVHKTCRYFGIARSSFYRWKSAFDREGESFSGGGFEIRNGDSDFFDQQLGSRCQDTVSTCGNSDRPRRILKLDRQGA